MVVVVMMSMMKMVIVSWLTHWADSSFDPKSYPHCHVSLGITSRRVTLLSLICVSADTNVEQCYSTSTLCRATLLPLDNCINRINTNTNAKRRKDCSTRGGAEIDMAYGGVVIAPITIASG
ncbi:hypothetical protein GW17_00003270 [Ensete ventricosum]|nr:hypothetical protein GW17_00003270 [Ensete ventricosum]